MAHNTSLPILFFFCSTFIFLSRGLYAQNLADSTLNVLEETVVEGYPDKISMLRSPASVGVLNEKQLANQPGYALVSAMNMLAGVRMEERSPGSYRLSIRGSLLRSPFGIRNVKMYMGDFPLTDAGGNTYLNLIDQGSIRKIEVLKGPHGSLYGANTGGVVYVNPFRSSLDSLSLNASLSSGSYGLFYQNANIERQWKKHTLGLYEAYQRSDGYRENSALDRKYVQLTEAWRYHKGNSLKVFAFYSDLNYQTPGGLTLKEYQQNPSAARPTTKLFSGAVQQKAGIMNKTLYGGISHETKILSNLRHVVSIFATHTDFQNPFITNYETRNEATFGTRTYLELVNPNEHANRNWKWNVGLEWQRTNSRISDYGNVLGRKDTIQSSDYVNARQYFFFSQLATQVGRLHIEGGVSLNKYAFFYRSVLKSPSPGLSAKEFDPQWMPRIALSYKLIENLYWRASISRGYSPPTIAEVRPSDNVIHTGLQPESGWNYESGFRFQNARLGCDAVVFYYRLQQAIVSRENANGTQYFVNAGGTNQPGFEWQAWASLLKPRSQGLLREIRFSNSFTYYQFTFSDYRSGSTDYSGNALTGVPQAVVVSGIEAQFAKGVFFYLQYNHTARTPLNDQNTDFATDYHLMQTKVGWKIPTTKRVQFEVKAGVDNLLNAKYSLGNDLNATGGRYYNAAPARNFYGGIGVSF